MKNPILVGALVMVLCFAFGCQNKAEKAEIEKMKAMAQTEEQNKAVALQFFQALDAQDYNRFNELLAPGSVVHYSGPQEDLSAETGAQLIRAFYQAFPNLSHTNEDILAEGNKVVARNLIQGTHQAEFQGIPASGNKVKYYQITIFEVVDGKIKEGWIIEDNLGLMTQLGMELKPKQEEKK